MKLLGLFATFATLWSPIACTVAQAGEPVLIPAEGKREAARLYLPQENFAPDHLRPLVVSLHGYATDREQHMVMFPLVEGAAARDALLLVPQGNKDFTGRYYWNATDFCCDFFWSGVDDVGYLKTLVEKMRAEYGADPTRIYLLGHSNGGFLANRFACEHPELVGGVASVAGGTFKKPEKCKNPQPLNFLQLHAVDDPVIRFEGNGLYAGATGSLDFWRQIGQCESDRRVGLPQDFVERIAGNDTEEESWACKSGVSVTLWKIGAFKDAGYNSHVPGFTPAVSEALLSHLLAARKP